MRARIASTVLSLALVVGVVIWLISRQAGSPGPLSPPHAAVLELTGAAGCQACHGGGDPERPLASACEACHAEIAAQRTARTGLHGRLDPVQLARCGDCHAEHRGEHLPLVSDAAFTRAVGCTLREYRHQDVDFALAGRHATLACAACHPHADAPWLAAGERRFLGLTQDCTHCHRDAHADAFGTDCAACHGQERPFAHAPHFAHPSFPLTGMHGQVACGACHPRTGTGSVLALQRAPPATARACVDCHENPHTGAVPARMFLASAQDCSRCHDPTTFTRSFGVAEHARLGVSLAGAHADAACADCHRPGLDLTARAPQELPACALCHDNPHLAAPDRPTAGAPAYRETSCRLCHDTTSFATPLVAGSDHVRFGSTLAAPHSTLACTACHGPLLLGAPAAGRPTPDGVAPGGVAPGGVASGGIAPSGVAPDGIAMGLATRRHPAHHDCASCHEHPHGAAFASQATCVQCHAAEAPHFRAATFTPAQHAATGFALDPPHHAVDCKSCHPGPQSPVARTRPGAPRSPDDCAACHQTPHLGARPGGWVAGARCVDCHADTHFAPADFTLTRHTATGFPLRGAHASIACASCHARDGRPAVHFAPLPTDCASCHPDPHGGRFARPGVPHALPDGRTGCARCHDEEGWTPRQASFDHATWTGFALVGRHAALACADCHGPSDGPSNNKPSGARRALPPTECAGCHEDPHAGQFNAGDRTPDCSACHGTDRFVPAHFDHERDTRFALTGSHADLDCTSCHPPRTLADGRTVIRYRPTPSTCQGCHGFGGGKR